MMKKDTKKASYFYGNDQLILLIYIVLYQCDLEKDLTMFEAGDGTEVGEKGLTLRYILAPMPSLNFNNMTVAVKRHGSLWPVPCTHALKLSYWMIYYQHWTSILLVG